MSDTVTKQTEIQSATDKLNAVLADSKTNVSAARAELQALVSAYTASMVDAHGVLSLANSGFLAEIEAANPAVKPLVEVAETEAKAVFGFMKKLGLSDKAATIVTALSLLVTAVMAAHYTFHVF